jgi:ferredoxin
MTRVINKEECIACGACESECPEGAISEGDGYYIINADLCKDCGDCEAVCPVECISEA